MTIYKSRFANIEVQRLSVSERIFKGLSSRMNDPVLIDGPSGRSLTGRETIDQIKCLAGGLNSKGLGAGKVMGIMAPNMPEYAIAFYGMLHAGGTVTTINPSYTAIEVSHQLQDAKTDLLVTTVDFLETAKAAVNQCGLEVEIATIGMMDGVPCLQDLMGNAQHEQTTIDLERHVAALPYSSGTTGLPKGVMLSHRNLVANIDQFLTMLPTSPGEAAVVFLPLFHIYGLNALLSPYLASGGCIVTMPRFDFDLYLKLVAEYRTPKLWTAPPVALGLAQHPAIDHANLSSVKVLFSAAAPLPDDIGAACASRLGCIVTQGYGMTELSPASHLTPPELAREGAVGLTAPNTETRIVNPETGESVGPNQEGEVQVRGPQVMLGYLNNPQATAETIIDNGWLRTGDLGFVDDDGYLYIRDRLKELIKFKGFQVAPAEVENALLSHPGISDAAVIGIPDTEAGELPCAYVVKKSQHEVSAEDLNAHVSRRLASYKRPAKISFVEAIPKSASGKILRRILKAQALSEAN